MSDSNTTEFLRKRGFILHHDTENRYLIKIGRRSVGGGLNEIFIETDELDAIGELGCIEKIIHRDDTIKLSVKERKQTLYDENNRPKNTSQEFREKLEQRKDEKGGK
jgi:hypothetical protein